MRQTVVLLLLIGGWTATEWAGAAGVFRHIEGDSRGEGVLMRRQAAFRMTWRLETGDFATLSFSNGLRFEFQRVPGSGNSGVFQIATRL